MTLEIENIFYLVKSINKALKQEEQMSDTKPLFYWAMSMINIDYSSWC